MSTITNDGLTRSGAGCFIAVPMATVGVKGLNLKTIWQWFYLGVSSWKGRVDVAYSSRATNRQGTSAVTNRSPTVCISITRNSVRHLTCSLVSIKRSSCSLRSAESGDLFLPRTRTTRLVRRSFFIAAPVVWNSLPLHLRSPSISRSQFWAGLKTHLSSWPFTDLRTIEEIELDWTSRNNAMTFAGCRRQLAFLLFSFT